jgi:hypothetical protein
MTSDELFAQVDLDGGGTLDKREMMEGLKAGGFIIAGEDLNMVWPMFCENAQGKISHVEWTEFLSGKTTFNYKHVLDRHLANLPGDAGSAVEFQGALPVTPQHGADSAQQKPRSARATEEGQLPRRPLFSLPDNHPRVRADAIKSSVQERLNSPRVPRESGRKHRRHHTVLNNQSRCSSASSTDTVDLQDQLHSKARQLEGLELEQMQTEATTKGRRPPNKHRTLSAKKGGVANSDDPFPPKPKPPKRLKPRKPKALPTKTALPVVDMDQGTATRLKPRPQVTYEDKADESREVERSMMKVQLSMPALEPPMRRAMSTKELMHEITDNQESPSWVSLVCAMSRKNLGVRDGKAVKKRPKPPKPPKPPKLSAKQPQLKSSESQRASSSARFPKIAV